MIVTSNEFSKMNITNPGEQLRCRSHKFITEILEIAKLLVNATRRGRVTGQCYEEDEIVLR